MTGSFELWGDSMKLCSDTHAYFMDIYQLTDDALHMVDFEEKLKKNYADNKDYIDD